MANFGFEHLTVVAPFEAHWREAKSAIGAPDLLQQAREAATLGEAVAHCTLVAGTGTLDRRKPEQPVVLLPDLGPRLQPELDGMGRVALVFGPEKHGLIRDDLSYCHMLVEIPTGPRQPSMNLGQAAAVCLYELACRSGPAGDSQPAKACEPPGPSSASLDRVAGLIEETMIATDYSPRAMQAANRHDLRLLLRRLALSAHDTRRVLGLFRRILWRLARTTPPADGEP